MILIVILSFSATSGFAYDPLDTSVIPLKSNPSIPELKCVKSTENYKRFRIIDDPDGVLRISHYAITYEVLTGDNQTVKYSSREKTREGAESLISEYALDQLPHCDGFLENNVSSFGI